MKKWLIFVPVIGFFAAVWLMIKGKLDYYDEDYWSSSTIQGISLAILLILKHIYDI